MSNTTDSAPSALNYYCRAASRRGCNATEFSDTMLSTLFTQLGWYFGHGEIQLRS
jgi:hypothetical protein